MERETRRGGPDEPINLTGCDKPSSLCWFKSKMSRLAGSRGTALLSLLALVCAVGVSLCARDVTVVEKSVDSVRDGECMDAIRAHLFKADQANSPYWAATGQIAPYDGESQLLWYGRYDNCEAIQDGKYCLGELLFSPESHLPPLHINQTQMVRWGICAVDLCNNSVLEDNMEEIIKGVFGWDPVYLISKAVYCTVQVPHYTAGFIATVTIIAILLGLCLIGTIVDLRYKHMISSHPKLVHSIDARGPHLVHPISLNTVDAADNVTSEEGREEHTSTGDLSRLHQEAPPAQCLRKAFRTDPGRCTLFWQCFSVSENSKQIFATGKSEGRVSILDSLRVLSMMWIITGHLYLGTFATGFTENLSDLLGWMDAFWWQFVGNAYYAVDTFLFLSGLLLAMQGLKAMNLLGGKLPVPALYLHRYIRLTMAMGLSMLLWIYVLPVMGSGPTWYTLTDQTNCDNYWWTNFLYIQNFYPTNNEDQCLGWFWYLAVDFQCFLVSPLILYALYRFERKGVIGVIACIIVSIIVTACLIGAFNINVNLTASVAANDASNVSDFENIVYTKPYCRISPYLIGMLLGYKLNRDKGQPIRMTLVKLMIGWIACIGTAICLIWAFYFHLCDGSMALNILYGSLGHPLWALALAWLVYASFHGCAGIVGDWLSWEGWQPLSRLTYSAYIVHPILMFGFNCSMKASQHISFYFMLLHTIGFIAMAYLFAIALMLLCELPIANLQNFYRVGLPGRKSTQPSHT